MASGTPRLVRIISVMPKASLSRADAHGHDFAQRYPRTLATYSDDLAIVTCCSSNGATGPGGALPVPTTNTYRTGLRALDRLAAGGPDTSPRADPIAVRATLNSARLFSSAVTNLLMAF